MEQITFDKNGHLPEGFVISNRYVIESLLGSGGMGSVYLAHDTVLEGAPIAVKVLHREISGDEAQSKRFLREVQLMRSVNNPYVVRTFDVGLDGDLLYYTMEYVRGDSLTALMKDNALPIEQMVEIFYKVCLGLQAVHEKDIIHRDLKPANIMVLDDLQVKITDFGVAKAKGSNLTQHDEIIGSVSYIAPEIWLGKPISASADLYSLGIILFELLVGKVPFDDDEPATMMWYHVKQPPTPPKSLRDSIPNWLNQLTLKLLSKNPEERPRSAKEVADTLARNMAAGNLKADTNVNSSGSQSALSRSQIHSKSKRATYQKSQFSRRWIALSVITVSSMLYVASVAYGFISSLLLL